MGYTSSAGTSISNSVEVVVPFTTKVYDSHNAWNGTDTYTIPVSGKYRVSGNIQFANSLYAAGNQCYLAAYKNGVQTAIGPLVVIAAALTVQIGCGVNITMICNAGDTIQLKAENNRTAGATLLAGASTVQYISIERVGN